MTIKITPGMRKRLREIKNPNLCRWVKFSRQSITCQATGPCSHGSPNHVMLTKLEDAGLIEWFKRPDSTSVQARLTPAGLAASN